MFTFAQTKAGYAHLWDTAKVYSPKVDAEAQASKVAKRIIALRPTFDPVEAATGVPWWMVGGILYREADLNTGAYLGNGQSLSHRTTVVPIGRGSFSSFLAGAIDAIHLEGIPLHAKWTIEFALYWTEHLNGFGYFALNVNSPYIWNWTDLYSGGKYVADHNFDRSVWDVQGGVAAIWKELAKIENLVFAREGGTTPTQKPDVPVVVPSKPSPSPLPTGSPADDLISSLRVLLVDIPTKFFEMTQTLRRDTQKVLDDVVEIENFLSPVSTPPAIQKGSVMNTITSNPVTSTIGGGSLLFAAFQLFNGIATKDPNLIGQGVLATLTGVMGLLAKDGHK